MKGFFIAALSSFVSGVLVLLFQYLALPVDKAAAEKRTADVVSQTPIVLSNSDARSIYSWFNSAPDYVLAGRRDRPISVALFNVSNTGNVDIQDATVQLNSAGDDLREVIAFKVAEISKEGIVDPNENRNLTDIPIEHGSNVASYHVPLLKVGEELEFVVIGSDVAFPKLEIRSKDVGIESAKDLEKPISSDEGDYLDWLVVGIFILGALFLGIGIGEYFHRDAFKKVGLDYDEMMALYKEALKKDG